MTDHEENLQEMSPTERDAIIAQAAAMLGISTDDARAMVYGTHASGLRVYGVEYREPKASASPEIKPGQRVAADVWVTPAWSQAEAARRIHMDCPEGFERYADGCYPSCSADFDMYCFGDAGTGPSDTTYPTPDDTTYPRETATCGRCNGRGLVWNPDMGLAVGCETCDGTGKLDVLQPEPLGYHPRIGTTRQSGRVLRALVGVAKAWFRGRT